MEVFVRFDFIFDKMEKWVGVELVENSTSKTGPLCIKGRGRKGNDRQAWGKWRERLCTMGVKGESAEGTWDAQQRTRIGPGGKKEWVLGTLACALGWLSV